MFFSCYKKITKRQLRFQKVLSPYIHVKKSKMLHEITKIHKQFKKSTPRRGSYTFKDGKEPLPANFGKGL